MKAPTRRPLPCALALVALAGCAEEATTTNTTGDAATDVAPDAAPDAAPDTTAATVDTEAPARVRAGEAIAVRCVARNRAGMALEGLTPELRWDPASLVRLTAMPAVATRVGTVRVACALPTASLVDATPASVEIVAGPPARVTTVLDRSSITAGEQATARCEVTDAEGNPIADATPTVAVMPTGEGVRVTGNVVAATRAGTYAVQCTLGGATGQPASLEVRPALPASLRIARVPDRMVYALQDEVEVESVVQDRYGNRIAMPTLSHESAPMGGTQVRAGRFRYDAEGRYTITVAVTGATEGGRALRETTSFVVDSTGPAIACEADATMRNVRAGEALTVRGTLRDTSGVRSVAVGGRATPVAADGTFSASVPARWGMNFVEVSATDTLGQENVRHCTWLASDRWQPESGLMADGVALQLTQAAVDDDNPVTPITSVGDILQTVLNSQGLSNQLHAALLAGNPLYDQCLLRPCVLGVCTCIATARVDYRDRELRGPNTSQLTLVNGGLRARVRLENLGVRLRVGGTISTDAWVRFRSVDVDVVFDLGASGGMPRVSVRPSSAMVTVGTVSVEIVGSGFASNVLQALVGVITTLANGQIRDLVSRTLRDYVQTSFNSTLNDLVRGLDVASLAPTFDVPRLDGMGSVGLAFGLNISTLDATTARLEAGLGTRLTPARMARATPSLGVALPAVGAAEPARRTPATVLLRPAVLDQALHALWRGGFFDTGLSASGVSARLQALLPPVASLRDDGRVALELGALTGTVTLPGAESTPVRATLGARASAAVTLMGNDLRFGDVRVDELVVNFDDTSMSAMENADLRRGLQQLVQLFVDRSLNDALPAIPIPGFRIPDSLRSYGLPVGRELGITAPALATEQGLFVLRGGFGLR